MNKQVKNKKFNVIAVNCQPHHLDAVFLGKVFKGKMNTCSVMITVGLRVPTKVIRDLSTLHVNNISGHSSL
jgi:hypothetical protein